MVVTLYSKINEDFTENYLSLSALSIILSTCLGSVAVMLSLFHGNGFLPMFLVFLSVAGCGAHLVAFLTVQKPRMVLNLLIFSLVLNTLLIIVNSLF